MSSKLLKLSQANLESSTNYRNLAESLTISMIIEFKETKFSSLYYYYSLILKDVLFSLILFESLEILPSHGISHFASRTRYLTTRRRERDILRVFLSLGREISLEEDGKLSAGNGERLSMLNHTTHIGQIFLLSLLPSRVKFQSIREYERSKIMLYYVLYYFT